MRPVNVERFRVPVAPSQLPPLEPRFFVEEPDESLRVDPFRLALIAAR